MAILQALFAAIGRSAGKVLNTIFGWAVIALFGRTQREQTLLSGAKARVRRRRGVLNAITNNLGGWCSRRMCARELSSRCELRGSAHTLPRWLAAHDGARLVAT